MDAAEAREAAVIAFYKSVNIQLSEIDAKIAQNLGAREVEHGIVNAWTSWVEAKTAKDRARHSFGGTSGKLKILEDIWKAQKFGEQRRDSKPIAYLGEVVRMELEMKGFRTKWINRIDGNILVSW